MNCFSMSKDTFSLGCILGLLLQIGKDHGFKGQLKHMNRDQVSLKSHQKARLAKCKLRGKWHSFSSLLLKALKLERLLVFSMPFCFQKHLTFPAYQHTRNACVATVSLLPFRAIITASQNAYVVGHSQGLQIFLLCHPDFPVI